MLYRSLHGDKADGGLGVGWTFLSCGYAVAGAIIVTLFGTVVHGVTGCWWVRVEYASASWGRG